MKHHVIESAVFLLTLVATLSASAFQVVERDGRLSVTDGGRMVLSDIAVERDGASGEVRFARSDRNGVKVWNRWDETRDGRYRLEVAEHPDGRIEITMSGQVDPYDKVRSRYLRLDVPKGVFDGKAYRALAGNGRKWDEKSGTLDGTYKATTRDVYRWFVVDGCVFDFNPIGAVDYCSSYQDAAIKGQCSFVARKGGGFEIRGGSTCGRSYGGYTGAKLVLRKGTFDDYDTHHLVRDFRYSDHLKASRRLSFGAKKTGPGYVDGQVAWQAEKGFGWEAVPTFAKVVNGAKEGVLYSAVSDSGKAVYRFSGLADGYYVVTVSSGNCLGTANRFGFTVEAGGSDVWQATDLTVAPKTARSLSRAVYATGGEIRLVLDGRWLVSAIALQPVMGDGEDFSVARGFWVSDGYEPCTLFRNVDFAAKPVFPVADETIDLPEPGKEYAGASKPIPAPVELPDPESPELAWLKKARIGRCLGNNVSMAELEDPATMKKWFDDNVEGHGYNVLFFSGMHSRHTYTGHLERGIEQTRRQAAEAHRRGMKYFDHHDATLMWNVMGGLRCLMERLPELIRGKADNLPSYQFCPCNETFRRKYYGYLRRLVEAGVDGFQIDEIGFWRHGCVCADCRRKFHEDTGWYIPANECDSAFSDKRNPLARTWFEWRRKAITNWFVELRRRLKDIKPDLVVCMYTTHYGFIMNSVDAGGHADLIDGGRAVNFFGTEVMTQNVMQSARCLPVYRKMYRLLNLAYGCSLWGFYYGSTPENAYFATCLGNMNGELAMPPEVPRKYGQPDAVAFCGSPDNMVRAGAEVWRVDAPGKVFTTLWREADGTLVAHFLNATGCDDLKVGERCTFDSPKVPFPALEKDIVFTVPGGEAATAYSPDFAFGGRPLATRRNADGTLTVTLPKELLKGYALVKIPAKGKGK